MDSHHNSAVLYRNLNARFLSLARGRGIYLELENGLSVIDASGGAAVACIGHGDQRVRDAIVEQLDKVAYCSTLFYTSDVCEKLCQELVSSTNGHMSRAYIVSSGKFHDGGIDDGTQAADTFPKRFRGYGGIHEVGTAVLSRETPARASEDQIYCAKPVLSWHDIRFPLNGRTCQSTSQVRADAVEQHLQSLALLFIQGPGAQGDGRVLRGKTCRRT